MTLKSLAKRTLALLEDKLANYKTVVHPECVMDCNRRESFKTWIGEIVQYELVIRKPIDEKALQVLVEGCVADIDARIPPINPVLHFYQLAIPIGIMPEHAFIETGDKANMRVIRQFDVIRNKYHTRFDVAYAWR